MLRRKGIFEGKGINALPYILVSEKPLIVRAVFNCFCACVCCLVCGAEMVPDVTKLTYSAMRKSRKYTKVFIATE